MANERKDSAILGREDISQFVVHLTRTTDEPERKSAMENLTSILDGRCIEARNAHCLYNKQIALLPEREQRRFRVACFTEIPLNQIHLLVRRIEGRSVHLRPYGLVFRKKLLIERNAQPAIYINSYAGNTWLREAADRLAEAALPIKPSKKLWRLMPFISAMHERYDFSWEREWRVRGDFEFRLADLVCVILPDDGLEDLKGDLARAGMAVISPGWRYEQIVSELSRQQRHTRRIHRRLIDEMKLDRRGD